MAKTKRGGAGGGGGGEPFRVLFAHTNYPAQFGGFGEWLAAQGFEVAFLTQRQDARSDAIRIATCSDHRAVGKETHRYVRPLERAAITGQAFARAGIDLAKDGFQPDLVMAHSGWGAGLYLKDVWPQSAYVPYFEWYYSWPAVDRLPDDKLENPVEGRAFNRTRNAPLVLDFTSADLAICPTRFQARQFPSFLRDRLTIMHDGIDTDVMHPGDRSRAVLDHWGIPRDAEIVTSITRGMEPHRGFPEIMRAIAILQKSRPKLHAVIGGEDRVAYGAKLPEGDSWKRRMLAELDLDRERLHFTGLLPRPAMVKLMAASDVHTYLTVPFVLSWSLLDAMSTGCLIVASDTPPVREFMEDGKTGLLVPMHDHEALAARIAEALDNREGLERVRNKARVQIVEHLDAKRVIWPKRKTLIEKTIRNRKAALARAGATA